MPALTLDVDRGHEKSPSSGASWTMHWVAIAWVPPRREASRSMARCRSSWGRFFLTRFLTETWW